MSRSTSFKKAANKPKWGGGTFTGLARVFMESNVLKNLSPYGCKLFLDLLSLYNNFNNGDLSVTWKVMQHRGWSGKSTLEKALKELLSSKVLIVSRQGGRNRCSLYALSMFAIDACGGKLEEIRATEKPTYDWFQTEMHLSGGLQNTNPAPLVGANFARLPLHTEH